MRLAAIGLRSDGVNWTSSCAGLLAFIALGMPERVGGQIIMGRVLREDSLTTVSSVLVTATDPTGALVYRSISSTAGAYSLRLDAGGTYTLRATHIGSVPFQLSNLNVEVGVTVVRDIVLKGLPLELAPLIARAGVQCGVPQSESDAIVSYWTRARNLVGLSDSAATAGGVVARFAVVDGSMDKDKSHVVRDSADARELVWKPGLGRGALLRGEPRTSLPLDLADPAVILSDDFVGHHCFRIDSEKRRDGLVGIRFSAMAGTDAVDLAGTLWLDSASATARALDFRFTGLKPSGRVCSMVVRREVPACVQDVETPDVGGRMEFSHLPTGELLVSRWRIQFAPDSVVSRTSFSSAPAPRNAAPTYDAHRIGMFVLRLRISEGAIATVSRGGEEVVYSEPALGLLRRRSRP